MRCAARRGGAAPSQAAPTPPPENDTTSDLGDSNAWEQSGQVTGEDHDGHGVLRDAPAGGRVGKVGARDRPNSHFTRPTDVSDAPRGGI